MRIKKFLLAFIGTDLLIMSIGIYALFKPDKDYKQTQGTIVNIIENYDSINDTISCQTIINYSVNNIEYNNVEYGAYNSSMKIGDQVIVYYDEDDPSLIQAEGYEKVPYIVIAMSIVFLIITLVTFTKIK